MQFRIEKDTRISSGKMQQIKSIVIFPDGTPMRDHVAVTYTPALKNVTKITLDPKADGLTEIYFLQNVMSLIATWISQPELAQKVMSELEAKAHKKLLPA